MFDFSFYISNAGTHSRFNFPTPLNIACLTEQHMLIYSM